MLFLDWQWKMLEIVEKLNSSQILKEERNFLKNLIIRFDDNFMAIEMRRTEVEMLKPIYVGQPILDISKTIMYEFWYDYLKPKYGDKTKLCYMDTDRYMDEEFYKDISKDVKRWLDTSRHDKNLDRPLEIDVNKNVLSKFKD